MKLLKNILNKMREFNQELNANNEITWLEFRSQWLKENNIECK